MITSMINSRIRHVLLLQEKSRARSKEGLFVTEGVRMFEEVPEEALKEIYCSESFYLSLTEKRMTILTGKGSIRSCADAESWGSR